MESSNVLSLADRAKRRRDRYQAVKLEHARRATLSATIAAARRELGWSLERTAEEATNALRRAAEAPDLTAEEIRVWGEIEITRHQVANLENCPAVPLADRVRRARLLGVTLALRLDRALINRLAGGI